MTIEYARIKLIDMHLEMCEHRKNVKPLECLNCDCCEEHAVFRLADRALQMIEDDANFETQK